MSVKIAGLMTMKIDTGDGFLFQKPLSQMHRSTFLPLQHTATLIFSVDWG